jgi:hypothetical protein
MMVCEMLGRAPSELGNLLPSDWRTLIAYANEKGKMMRRELRG